MAKESKIIINCDCLVQKKFNDLTQSDKCICRIGTSDKSKKVIARRVNVTKVKEFSPFS